MLMSQIIKMSGLKQGQERGDESSRNTVQKMYWSRFLNNNVLVITPWLYWIIFAYESHILKRVQDFINTFFNKGRYNWSVWGKWRIDKNGFEPLLLNVHVAYSLRIQLNKSL